MFSYLCIWNSNSKDIISSPEHFNIQNAPSVVVPNLWATELKSPSDGG